MTREAAFQFVRNIPKQADNCKEAIQLPEIDHFKNK